MVTEEQVKAYYNARHRELGAGAWRPPVAFPHFLYAAGVQAGQTMLDVGCGPGLLIQAARSAGIDASGVDLSEEAVAIARAENPEARIEQGPGESLPFPDEHFDAVFCLGALEHFLDMKKGMLEMVRVGKSTSTFLIVVPNTRYLGWFGKAHKGTEQQDINEQLHTLNEWKQFFIGCGLRIQSVRQDRWWFVNRWRHMPDASLLARTKALVRGLGWLLVPLPWTYQFVFVMNKQ